MTGFVKSLRSVLPAYAGMIPTYVAMGGIKLCAPRVCGDDPLVASTDWYEGTCSPRMRG